MNESIKKIFIIFCFGIGSLAYGMEKKFIAIEVTDKKQIAVGDSMTVDMLDKEFENKHNDPGYELCQKLKPFRLEKILAPKDLIAAFIQDTEKNNVGFIAAHQHEQDFERIIIKSMCPGVGEQKKEIVPFIIGYLKMKYPKAHNVAFWLPKNSNVLSEQALSYGFEKVDRKDVPDYAQSWEKSL